MMMTMMTTEVTQRPRALNPDAVAAVEAPRPSVLWRIDKEGDDSLFAKSFGGLQPV